MSDLVDHQHDVSAGPLTPGRGGAVLVTTQHEGLTTPKKDPPLAFERQSLSVPSWRSGRTNLRDNGMGAGRLRRCGNPPDPRVESGKGKHLLAMTVHPYPEEQGRGVTPDHSPESGPRTLPLAQLYVAHPDTLPRSHGLTGRAASPLVERWGSTNVLAPARSLGWA